MVHVPYKGGPEAIQAVLKGETCCIFNQVQTVLPALQGRQGAPAGRHHRPSASAAMPDVPTIAEAGLPGYESYTWFGDLRAQGPRSRDRRAR